MLQLVKSFQDNIQLRTSFNDLAQSTFGINFELWYERGYWTNQYEPYSFIDGQKVVANVSVNKLNLIIDGAKYKAIQIGTVMTHPDFQNNGLSKRLMEKVLVDYEDIAQVIYLFANQSVLEYYPRFGFQEIDEHLFSLNITPSNNASKNIKKLSMNNSNDRVFFYEFAKTRYPNSQTFSTVSAAELVMFYSLYVFSKDIVYLVDDDVIVICKQEGQTLHVYDVMSKTACQIELICEKFADEITTKIIVHFTPNNTEHFEHEKYKGNEVLFVKLKEGIELPKYFKHPIISQA